MNCPACGHEKLTHVVFMHPTTGHARAGKHCSKCGSTMLAPVRSPAKRMGLDNYATLLMLLIAVLMIADRLI